MTTMKKTIAIAAVAILMSGCVENVRQTTGVGLGAIAGGVIGNQFGKGRGKMLATSVGAVAGAFAGSAIGMHLDEAARAAANRSTVEALDWAVPGGPPIRWESPATSSTPANGHVYITRQGRNAAHELCREYNQIVIVGDDVEEITGTMCRSTAGDWRTPTHGANPDIPT